VLILTSPFEINPTLSQIYSISDKGQTQEFRNHSVLFHNDFNHYEILSLIYILRSVSLIFAI